MLVGLGHDAVGDLVEFLIRMAGHIHELHVPAAHIAQARQSRGIGGDDGGLWGNLCPYAKEGSHCRIHGLVIVGPLAPVLHADNQKTCAGLRGEGQHIKARDPHGVLDALDIFQSRSLQLVHGLLGLVQGSALGQVHHGKGVALILVGYECGGQLHIEKGHQTGYNQKEENGQAGAPDKPGHYAHIALLGALEPVVEAGEEASEKAFLFAFVMTLQNHSAESRGKGQGHKGGKRHGNGDGECKLAIEHAGHASQEGHRHEHRRQDESNSHHRPLHLVHGPLRGIHRLQALLHVLFHVLDDHDGIINHQADGQHQGKEGQSIDGEIQKYEGCQSADQRYRHRQQRNDGSPPVLQEDEYDEHHQGQSLEKGFQHLVNRSIDIIRAVHDFAHFQAGRQVGLGLFDNFPHPCHRLHGVGIIGEHDAEAHGGSAVALGNNIVVLLAFLYPGYILQPHKGAIVAIGLDDDVTEFLRGGETSLDLAGVLLFLSVVHRHAAYGTGRSLDILLI